MDKWTEIRDLCANEGIEKFVGKTPEYVRDGIYGQFKKRTLEKVDNYKKSGFDGGRLTDAENLLLEIVDRESPTVVGLNVSETGQPMSTFEKELGSNTSQFVEESEEMGVQTKDSEVGPSQMQMLASNLNKRKRQASLDDQIKMAKLNCIKAQTELYNEQVMGRSENKTFMSIPC
uniref:Uncharacterized protein n=1 Tax=Acrobeloides nanus TaxID=290746 RepID=A0A914ED40_9BILA